MKSTRDGFGEALYELVAADRHLMVLTADSRESTRVEAIARDFPEQFVEVGIGEQDMAGIAAGMALAGKTVITTAFATFQPGRNWEQLRLSICEQNLPVICVGTHAGLATGPDGTTHQMLEDIALATALPHMRVVAPADAAEAAASLRALAATPGPAYLRLTREPVADIDFGRTQFKLGQVRLLRRGRDALIASYGQTLPLALQAADELKKDVNLNVGVVDVATLQPLDKETLCHLAAQAGAVVTIEDHQCTGGLGSLLASLFARQTSVPMEMIAVNGRFGASGTVSELYERYGLTAANLREAVLRVIERRVQASRDKNPRDA